LRHALIGLLCLLQILLLGKKSLVISGANIKEKEVLAGQVPFRG